jgi:hypothetical protein
MCVIGGIHAAFVHDLTSVKSGMILATGMAFMSLGVRNNRTEVNMTEYSLPLILGVFSLAIICDQISNRKLKGFVCLFLMSLTAFGYYLWHPFVYGKKLKDENFLLWKNG